MFSSITGRVLAAVLTAIILGVSALIWQLLRDGGLVSAVGGVSKATLESKTVPRGAVVAFDLDSGCPEGWSKFAQAQSRTIVGASFGDNSIDTKKLSEYRHDVKGGEETVVLTDAHMPVHTHQFEDIFYSENPGQTTNKSVKFQDIPDEIGSNSNDHDNKGWAISKKTGPSGHVTKQQESVAIIQPFIALYYCKKD